jgi:hypothetical protein
VTYHESINPDCYSAVLETLSRTGMGLGERRMKP